LRFKDPRNTNIFNSFAMAKEPKTKAVEQAPAQEELTATCFATGYSDAKESYWAGFSVRTPTSYKGKTVFKEVTQFLTSDENLEDFQDEVHLVKDLVKLGLTKLKSA